MFKNVERADNRDALEYPAGTYSRSYTKYTLSKFIGMGKKQLMPHV